MDLTEQFAPFAARMRREGLPDLVIENFRHAYARLRAGETGVIPGSGALPIQDLPHYDDLGAEDARIGEEALGRTVVCKLNGGLGTSMGMSGPKSLLPVKDGLSFLDITARQVLHRRRQSGARLPLVLMDSFSTHQASLAALSVYPEFEQELPLDFVQNKVPKVAKAGLVPVDWPDDPEKEWCPPGHGDIYPSLITTGLLDDMLGAGYDVLFVSNADNLGAVLDERILGSFVRCGCPFLMEVTQRTPADSKGGHLARRPDGQLILRESAQCPPDEQDQFQDISLYRFFNTNNLWIHLPALRAALTASNGVLDLPLIVNEKAVDSTQPESPRVYQLETAMGSAISLFAGAQALVTPRNRFAPVKKNSDLLVLWSDVYQLLPDFTFALAAARGGSAPVVRLDDRYYGVFAEMEDRFPHGAPSLIGCESLSVIGDVRFGREVVVEGNVTIEWQGEGQLRIEDGARLRG